MSSVRDLAGVGPWRESLERSLARRGRSASSSTGIAEEPGTQPADDRGQAAAVPGSGPRRGGSSSRRHALQEARSVWRALNHGVAWRWGALVASGVVLLAAAVLAAAMPSVSGGDRARGPVRPARAAGLRSVADARRAATGSHTAGASSRGAAATALVVPRQSAGSAPVAGIAQTRICERVGKPAGYANPLAGAAVTPKRIDQGVDYAGSGALVAIGPGTITMVAQSDTGWPGAFIEYQLTEGPAAGCFVFYAEGVTPASGLAPGQAVKAGQSIATIDPENPNGIEVGWGAGIGTQTYAAQLGEWHSGDDQDSVPSASGKSFSALIAALGGPPGKIMQHPPARR